MNFCIARRGLLAFAAVCISLLSACTPASAPTPAEEPLTFSALNMEEITMDAAGLAAHLLSEMTFDDALIQIEDSIAEKLFDVSGLYTDIEAYGSTGATAEMVVVLRSDSAANAAEAAARLETYRTDMAEVYAGYNVPESEKLTKALLACDGIYVVFCVSPDTARAETLYHDYACGAAMPAEE